MSLKYQQLSPQRTKHDYLNRKKQHAQVGRISLFHNGALIITVRFMCPKDRREIMNKWHKLYKLENKTNVYFDVTFD